MKCLCIFIYVNFCLLFTTFTSKIVEVNLFREALAIDRRLSRDILQN